MINAKLIVIFTVAVVLDGLILPAFFGLQESLLSLLVLIVPFLYFGFYRQYVVYGLFFSIVLEISRGLDFGKLAIPFLLTLVLIYLTQKFFDIKYTHFLELSVGRSIGFSSLSVFFVYIFSGFYKWNFGFKYLNPAIIFFLLIEAFALMLVFGFIFNTRDV